MNVFKLKFQIKIIKEKKIFQYKCSKRKPKERLNKTRIYLSVQIEFFSTYFHFEKNNKYRLNFIVLVIVFKLQISREKKLTIKICRVLGGKVKSLKSNNSRA